MILEEELKDLYMAEGGGGDLLPPPPPPHPRLRASVSS